MTKTDDAMKRLLDSIGDVGDVKRRRFIGTSRMDQEIWSRGGLSFGINNRVYGSCDFAWFRKEEWVDPLTKLTCEEKPLLVIEATDCLNTRSWGSAQIQRFHHALGSFLCGINSVYFLNEGTHPARPYLHGAAYFATQYHKLQGNNAAYLITSKLEDICDLVTLLGKSGENSEEFRARVELILKNMLDYFNKTFLGPVYCGDWIKYLESREIIRTPGGKWIKDIGARKRNFTEGSQRYGHIVVGEAITTKYLLIGSGKFDPSRETFYYLLPLLRRDELRELDKTLTSDKEWQILRNDPSWQIVTFDDIRGLGSFGETLTKFKDLNLNKTKRDWEHIKEKMRQAFMKGTFEIVVSTENKHDTDETISKFLG